MLKKKYEYKIWKGSARDYKRLHERIGRLYGKPKECNNCLTTEASLYDWANISGQYLEDRSDWRRLCRKCHMHIDGRAFSKPATGMKHNPEVKIQIASSMRRNWEENRSARMKTVLRGEAHGRYKSGKYVKTNV